MHQNVCTSFPLRSCPVVFAKTMSVIVVFFFAFVFTLLLLFISPSLYIVTVCVGSDGCVHLFVCVCVCVSHIDLFLYSISLCPSPFVLFLSTPLRRVPLCWLETSLITHRENLVCFRFRWMVVWVNGWIDGQGWEEKRQKEGDVWELTFCWMTALPTQKL